MVSTHLKNISQNGNLPQIGVKIKNVWNHHLATLPKTNMEGPKNNGLEKVTGPFKNGAIVGIHVSFRVFFASPRIDCL